VEEKKKKKEVKKTRGIFFTKEKGRIGIKLETKWDWGEG